MNRIKLPENPVDATLVVMLMSGVGLDKIDDEAIARMRVLREYTEAMAAVEENGE